ncbi:MAG: hypothetical protein ACTSUC_02570 [Promethearchaeota archaeon]
MTIMNLDIKLKLVLEASGGKDNIQQGYVGSNGYGFGFFDLKKFTPLMEYYRTISQLRCLNDPQEFVEKIETIRNNISDYLIESDRSDIKLVGAIKTLVPSTEFGGYESLFEVIVFTKTPENYVFPLLFYYGASGLAISGFDIESWEDKEYFREFFNFNPFRYNNKELETLIQAFHFALLKVPTSDFYGVYTHDFGNSLMGLKGGKIIRMELENIEPSFVANFYKEYK